MPSRSLVLRGPRLQREWHLGTEKTRAQGGKEGTKGQKDPHPPPTPIILCYGQEILILYIKAFSFIYFLLIPVFFLLGKSAQQI